MKLKKLLFIVMFAFAFLFVTACNTDIDLEQVYLEVTEDINVQGITEDINLITESNGVKITWVSNNKDVISNDGKVTRGLNDVVVELTVKLEKGKQSQTFKLSVKVLKIVPATDFDALYNQLIADINANSVTGNLVFSQTIEGSTVTWASDNQAAVANDGTVTRGLEDATATLTITITKGEESKTFTLTVKVLKVEVEPSDLDAIFEQLSKGIASEVTSDLTFATVLNGATISWSSSNTAIISNTGKVTRGAEDVVVSLAVVITKGNDSKDYTINVTVLKVEEVSNSIAAIKASSLDSIVIFEGVVTALLGSKVYVEDPTGAISLYNVSKDLLPNCEVGNKVSITGTLTQYNALLQVANVTEVEVLGTDFVPAAINGTTLDAEELAKNEFKRHDFAEVTYISQSKDFAEATDVQITIAIGADQLVLFVSKYLAAETYNQIANVFASAKKGDTFKLNGVYTTYYKSIQLEFSDSATAEALQGKVETLDDLFNELVKNISTNVTGDLRFDGEINGATVSWLSSNTSVISNTGVVVRGEEDVQVTIKVTLTKDEDSKEFELTLTVLKLSQDETITIAEAFDQDLDAAVKLSGTVSYVYGGRGFYLTDFTGNIYIYDSGQNVVSVGDEVVIEGVRAEYNGFPEIVPTVVTIKSNTTYHYYGEEKTLAELAALANDNANYGTVYKTTLELVASGNYINGKDGELNVSLYNDEANTAILQPLVGHKVSAYVMLYQYNASKSLWNFFVIGSSVVDLGEVTETPDPDPTIDPVAGIGYELDFVGLVNKTAIKTWIVDKAFGDKFAGMTMINNPGQSYGDYAGFGRSGDKDSSIITRPLTFASPFMISLVVKGNPSNNSMGTSYFLVKALDSSKNVIANGKVLLDSASLSTVGSTNGIPAVNTDSTVTFGFGADAFTEGKTFADAAYIEVNYIKDIGNLGWKSMTIAELQESSSTLTGTIAELKKALLGSNVVFEGVVTALLGRKVYIEDASGAISLYNVAEELLPSCVVGTKIKGNGSLTEYEGLIQISNASDITVVSQETTAVASIEMGSLAAADLESNEFKKVNFAEVTYISKSKEFEDDSQIDVQITISDGTNETVLFVSKYLNADTYNQIKSVFQTITKNAKVSLSGVYITYYNNVQLEFVDGSTAVLK